MNTLERKFVKVQQATYMETGIEDNGIGERLHARSKALLNFDGFQRNTL